MKAATSRRSPRYAAHQTLFHTMTINISTPSSPLSSHSQSPRNSNRGRSAGSTAADDRESRLLNDPLCKIINPHLTQCRGCGTEIKLSPKMLYDTCHWIAHSGRCTRPLMTGEQIESPRRLGDEGDLDDSRSSQGGVSDGSVSDSSSNSETLEAAHHLLLLAGRLQRN